MNGQSSARDALLQSVWQEILATTPDNVRNFPAAVRAIEAGAAVDDLVTAMRAASYETAFRLLYLLGSEHAPEGEARTDLGWTLAEFDLARGRILGTGNLEGIHEDLLEADPSGRGSADLWD